MARVTSVVGQSRSSISVLTELSISPQAPLERPNRTRCLVLPSLADALADALELLRHALVGGDDLVERVGDLAVDADVIAGHAHRKVADAHRLQRLQQFVHFGRGFAVAADGLVGFDGERQFDERAGGFAFALEGLRPGRHQSPPPAIRRQPPFGGAPTGGSRFVTSQRNPRIRPAKANAIKAGSSNMIWIDQPAWC